MNTYCLILHSRCGKRVSKRWDNNYFLVVSLFYSKYAPCYVMLSGVYLLLINLMNIPSNHTNMSILYNPSLMLPSFENKELLLLNICPKHSLWFEVSGYVNQLPNTIKTKTYSNPYKGKRL